MLQLRMLLDIFHSITNTLLLIACLLPVNYTCKRCGLWKDFIFYHNANPQMSCTFCAFYQFTPQIVRNSQVNQPSTGRLCTISLAHLPSNIPPPPIGSSSVSMSFGSYDHTPHSAQSSLETISAGYNDSKILKRVVLLTCLAFKG